MRVELSCFAAVCLAQALSYASLAAGPSLLRTPRSERQQRQVPVGPARANGSRRPVRVYARRTGVGPAPVRAGPKCSRRIAPAQPSPARAGHKCAS